MGCNELTPEHIEAPGAPDLVEAHLRELELWEDRLARLERLRALLRGNAAEGESPPDGQKSGASRTKLTPSDAQHPSDEVEACPSSSV